MVLLFYWLDPVKCFSQPVITTERTPNPGIVGFSSSSTSIMASAKYIDGYVRQYGSDKFVFPVGSNSFCRPFAAAADQTTGAYFSLESQSILPEGGPFSVDFREEGLVAVSSKELWDIKGLNSTKLTLTWNDESEIEILTANNLENLTIAGWNNETSQWEKVSSSIDIISVLNKTSSFTEGSITSNEAFVPDRYLVYTFALAKTAALPVQLIRFTATKGESQNVVLAWSTSSEAGSDYFDIQRSSDGSNWFKLYSVAASGTSERTLTYTYRDLDPLSGENLYRLKMVDEDGAFSFSSIRKISFKKKDQTFFFPNPAKGRIFIHIDNKKLLRETSFYNVDGKIQLNFNGPLNYFDLQKTPSGIYIVEAVFDNGEIVKQKVVVQRED